MKESQITTTQCANMLTAIGDALYVIGGKWKLRVIVALREESKRFNEIQRTVEGISARVLSAELKELEMNGFVKRTVHHKQTPVMVEYQLTEYADTLSEVLQSLANWGILHREKLRRER
ncbi:helix-turn-helix domain-containing protein [Pedobacter sp. Du54]|uniref:winged helix-turn-helix transcriptional regulator n=1 Tax=Pedobacter anseongensis TaxID=3133439 RepID=UPI0030AE12CD